MLKSAQDQYIAVKAGLSTAKVAGRVDRPPEAPSYRPVQQIAAPGQTSLFLVITILRNRLFQAAISLIIGAFFLWRAIERTQMDEVWRKLHEVDLGWLLTALAAYWLALTLRSWR